MSTPKTDVKVFQKCPECGEPLSYSIELEDKNFEYFNRNSEDQKEALLNLYLANRNVKTEISEAFRLLEEECQWYFTGDEPDKDAPILFLRCPHCKELVGIIIVAVA